MQLLGLRHRIPCYQPAHRVGDDIHCYALAGVVAIDVPCEMVAEVLDIRIVVVGPITPIILDMSQVRIGL